MLRNVDYQKMEDEIASDAYRCIATLPIIAMLNGGVSNAESLYKNIASLIKDLPEPGNILMALGGALKSARKRRELMNAINSDPDLLKYSTPESKGASISIMIDVNFVDKSDPGNWNFTKDNFYKVGMMSNRKLAVFNSLYWIQSKKDYENVMQHISNDANKMNLDWRKGQQEVINFLGSGESSDLGIFSTQYAQKLLDLYDELPDGSNVESGSELKHISDDKMKKYLAIIDKHEVYQMAYLNSSDSKLMV